MFFQKSQQGQDVKKNFTTQLKGAVLNLGGNPNLVPNLNTEAQNLEGGVGELIFFPADEKEEGVTLENFFARFGISYEEIKTLINNQQGIDKIIIFMNAFEAYTEEACGGKYTTYTNNINIAALEDGDKCYLLDRARNAHARELIDYLFPFAAEKNPDDAAQQKRKILWENVADAVKGGTLDLSEKDKNGDESGEDTGSYFAP